MYKIDLIEMQVFLLVSKFRSFSRAADALNMTQPTVTKYVKHLEAELGFRLFVRTSRHVEPTYAGGILTERWKDLLAGIESSIKDAGEAAAEHRTVIRIGALYGYGFESFVSDYIQPFETSLPDVTVDFNIYDLNELSEQLETLDLILTVDYETGRMYDYVVRKLDDVPLYLAVSKGSSLAGRESVSAGDLAGESLLVLSSQVSPDAMTLAEKAFAAGSPQLTEVGNVPSLLMKVSQNKGVAVTGSSLIRGYEDMITLVKIEGVHLSMSRVLAYRPEKRSEGVKRLCNFLLESFKVQ